MLEKVRFLFVWTGQVNDVTLPETSSSYILAYTIGKEGREKEAYE